MGGKSWVFKRNFEGSGGNFMSIDTGVGEVRENWINIAG
jgi:hypothetical protein